jgi:ubiquinone/menaquinone biosynthesis C-methylase UbiE
MLRKILHRVVRNPGIYDRVQLLAGAKEVQRRVAAQIPHLAHVNNVLDVGGGTGLYQSLWPGAVRCICLDMSMAKLRGYRAKYPRRTALCADGTQIPLGSGTLDAVMCINVSHHLTDRSCELLIEESARVLKETGALLFVEAIWEPNRFMGRLLWKFDRGSHPRTAEYLRSLLQKEFKLTHVEQFCLYHRYLLCAGVKRSGASPDS